MVAGSGSLETTVIAVSLLRLSANQILFSKAKLKLAYI